MYIRGLEGCWKRGTEAAAEIFIAFKSELVGMIHIHRQTSICPGKFGYTENVVEMSMCEHYACGCESVLGNKGCELCDFSRRRASRVDECA
jgi:hypothetical protein